MIFSLLPYISLPPPKKYNYVQNNKIRLGGDRTHDPSIERAVSYHLTTNPN